MLKETKQKAEVAYSRPREDKWNWVERTIWTDRMLMALDNGVKGNKWFSLMDKVSRQATLHKGWRKVASNEGSCGTDQVSIERFAQNFQRYLEELEADLGRGTYQPSNIRRIYIPKGESKMRPLGIPTIKDRIVQTAIKMVMEPIWEREFLSMSFGFRPGRSARDALKIVNDLIMEGYTYVVDADIQGYFDTIPHEALMSRVKTKIADGRVLALIEGFLKAGIVDEMKEWKPTQGSPQGSVLSPLLANIYLHPLDVLMSAHGHKMVRYADDFVVLCKTAKEAKEALILIQKWIDENGLTLHPEKTQIGNCMLEGQGFEFLGYRFEQGYRHVRKKSLDKLKTKIRENTRRTSGKSVVQVIARLNKMLIGWMNYFKHAQGKVFRVLDQLIRRRLRAMLRKHEKRPGMGKTLDDHIRWPNSYFASRGLFSLEAVRRAWRMANQS